MRRSDSGFSLVEAMMVSAIVIIGSAVAVVQMRQSRAILDADKASNLVVAQVRYARQVAVDQRRNVRVDFTGTNRITVTRQDDVVETTVLADVTLPSGYTFGLPSGVGDTPDGFGNDDGVDFGTDTGGTFQGDGSFVSGAGIVLSGTVFTIGTGNGSARAVTITGATGRTKQYFIQGTSWIER
jgi:type II secretory pathway pseudopilin PulG